MRNKGFIFAITYFQEEIKDCIMTPIKYWKQKLKGVVPNVILHGSPGCGKSSILNAAMTSCIDFPEKYNGVKFYKVNCADICQQYYGKISPSYFESLLILKLPNSQSTFCDHQTF